MSPTKLSPQQQETQRKKKRLLLGACSLLGLGILMAIGAAGYILYAGLIGTSTNGIEINADLSEMEQQLVNQIFSGEQQSAGGYDEAVTLHLLPERRFELQTIFVARSDRPTVRTGVWYEQNEYVRLDFAELDGEPIQQAGVAFRLDSDALVAQTYDREWFNYETFILDLSGEVVSDSAE
ncbi:MAG: hypothetical protein ACPG8W_09930 [Candidatus Promineifilaceae bacterium]